MKVIKNPIGVFQGHYHAAKITQHDNVLYVNSPALVSYPNAFRVVSVTNHKDKVVLILNGKKQEKLLFKKWRKYLYSPVDSTQVKKKIKPVFMK